MGFKSDIEIAQECEMLPITQIAEKAGIDDKYLEQYGKYKAKIDYNLLKESDKKDGKLILVTVEQAVWLEHGNRHSAHIHSKNIDNITKYAKAIDTAILVKNAPSYAALGFGGEGYCTFTIASRTGEGLTCASTFTKRRRCVMADSLCIR